MMRISNSGCRVSTLASGVVLAFLSAFCHPAAAGVGKTTFEDWLARQRAAGSIVTASAIDYSATDDRLEIRNLIIELPRSGQATRWRFEVPVMTLVGLAPSPHQGLAASELSLSAIKLEIGIDARFDLGPIETRSISIPDFSDIAINPERRIATEVALLERAAEIRIEHIALGQSSGSVAIDGRQTTIGYAGLSIDGVGSGRIERISSGRMDLAMPSPDGPLSAHVGAITMEGYDYGYYATALDDDTYSSGPVDRSWHEIQRASSVTDMALSVGDVSLSIASARGEGTRMRRLEEPVGRAIDRVFATKGVDGDALLIEGRLLSAFSIDAYRIDGIEFSKGREFRSRIGSIGLSSLSPDGVETLFLEALEVAADMSEIDVASLRINSLAFPSYVELLRGIKVLQTNPTGIDPAGILPKLGHGALAGVRLSDPSNGTLTLDQLTVDLDHYIGAIPTDVRAVLSGFSIPSSALDDPGKKAVLKQLGYDRVDLGASIAFSWHEDRDEIEVGNLSLSLENGGRVQVNARLGGAGRSLFEAFDPAELATLSLASLHLSYVDASLFQRAIGVFAQANDIQPAIARARINELFGGLPPLFADLGRQGALTRLLASFVQMPGRLDVTANPASPIPIVAIAIAAGARKPPIGDILNLEVTTLP